MAILREHRGEKFTPLALAARTGHPVALIAKVLAARAGDFRGDLRRENSAGQKVHQARFWISDVASQVDDTNEARHIARWMLRHRKAARPSEVARAVKLAPELVARQLDAWAACGMAVRCELVTRQGLDRFEYRLSFSHDQDPRRVLARAFSARAMA